MRDRLSLAAMMARFLPALEGWVGAKGALVTTRNEHLVEETYTFGEWTLLGGADLHAEEQRRAVVVGSGTSMWMKLCVAGAEVGRLAVLLPGDRRADEAEPRASARDRSAPSSTSCSRPSTPPRTSSGSSSRSRSS